MCLSSLSFIISRSASSALFSVAEQCFAQPVIFSFHEALTFLDFSCPWKNRSKRRCMIRSG